MTFCSASVARTSGPTDERLFGCCPTGHSVRRSVGLPPAPTVAAAAPALRATPAPPRARRPAERRRPSRRRGGRRRPAVRPAAAAGQAAGCRGRRAPTDGGGFVRGDRSTGRRQPCAEGAGGSTRRLPGVGRTRLRGERGGLDRQAARVGSALGRRRREARAVGGRDGGRLGHGRRRRDRDPLRSLWSAAVREPRVNPCGAVTGRRACPVARVVGGQGQAAPRARAGRAGGVDGQVGCCCDVR